MLAERGRGAVGQGAAVVEEQGGRDGLERAVGSERQRRDLAAGAGPGEGGAEVCRRRGRNAVTVQDLQPLRDRAGGEDGAEAGVESRAMADARGVGGEARIGGEIRPLEGSAEPAPEVLAAGAEDQPAVGGGVRLGGREIGVARAEACGLAAVGQEGLRGVPEKSGPGGGHRDLDVAGGGAPAGGAAVLAPPAIPTLPAPPSPQGGPAGRGGGG